MKVTLDLGKLLQEGKISQAEFDKLSALAARDTGSLAFNILIGFGVAAVSVGAGGCTTTRNMPGNPVSLQHQRYPRLLPENTLQGESTH